MFGNKSQGSARIWSFKARTPHDGADLIADQIHKAHRYRNRLIELERDRRSRVDAALAAAYPALVNAERAVVAIEAELEALGTAIGRRNAVARKRVATVEDRQRKAEIKVRLKEARALRKELRAAAFADPRFRATLDRIDAEDAAARKAARAASGLYWGTYLTIEQAMRDVRKGPPPRFRPWTPRGAVAVQLQGGLAAGEALACGDSRLRLQILPASPDADPGSRRSREKRRAVLGIRIGSIGRLPVWGRAVFHLHRPLPDDAVVKWAYLRRSVCGVRPTWEVQLTLERREWPRDHADAGVAGLDVGWRLVDGGLRVAYLVGSDGHEETLVLPAEHVAYWGKADSLRSIRDRIFDDARGRLSDWLRGRAGPDWLAERSEYLSLWKSPGRLAALVWHWKDHRFDGDETIYPDMEAWRKQNRHLHDWEAANIAKATRRRDKQYRMFAANIRHRYHTVRIEDTDWQAIERRPGPEEPDARDATRVNKRIAAVGRLLQFVREAVAVVEERPAAFTTLKCHVCGKVDRFDAAAELWHTCTGCGEMWDQDENAARNLLAAASEVIAEAVAV